MLVETKKHGRNSHRGRLDIIADILDASFVGIRKTHLMYSCNLSFKQLKCYLGLLLGKELLHVVTDNEGANLGLFRITDKGKKFLKGYEGLKGLMH